MSNKTPLFEGEGIKELIPQRAPIMMVDTFYDADEVECNFFIGDDGMFSEPGLIEHIAQSASAFAGYKEKLKNAEKPPVGYIGEIKKFKLIRRPKVGERVLTHIKTVSEIMNVSLIKTEAKVNDETIATCQMKIFIKE